MTYLPLRAAMKNGHNHGLTNKYSVNMTDPFVEPSDNGTEREIRHTVIDRRIIQGTRSDRGMPWCERIWTAIATCKKQNRNVFIHE